MNRRELLKSLVALAAAPLLGLMPSRKSAPAAAGNLAGWHVDRIRVTVAYEPDPSPWTKFAEDGGAWGVGWTQDDVRDQSFGVVKNPKIP